MESVKSAIEEDIDEDRIVRNLKHDDSGSDLLKAMEILHSNKNIESNTILTNSQVNALSLMNWAGQVYDIDFFKYYVTFFPKYRISGDDGRGRKELIQIAEAIQRSKIEENNKMWDFLNKR